MNTTLYLQHVLVEVKKLVKQTVVYEKLELHNPRVREAVVGTITL